MTQVKVSVIIPIYNAEMYLRQCLDSTVNQTLREIEIICVNDGSTDRSLEIIREYASVDDRIRVIDKPNTGYGHSLNCGLDLATGEYIGFVESDDYAENNMFEQLYGCASREHADVVKAGFYLYFSKHKERNIPYHVAARSRCGSIFCPVTDITAPLEQADFFNIRPSIWSAVYQISFLRNNGIRFNETPGASYQDTSFSFKVWACAKRVYLLRECLLHYRQDNEASSVNSAGKAYCVCDEYSESARFLATRPDLKQLAGLRTRLMYETYMWNYSRLDLSLRREFVLRASADFAAEKQAGHLDSKYFPRYKWGEVLLLTDYPEEFYRWRCGQKISIPASVSACLRETVLQKMVRKITGMIRIWSNQGFRYTLHYAKTELIND